MKNFSLVLNFVLLIAVAILFVLFFSKKKETTASGKTNNRDSLVTGGNFRIAYFEMDSIQENSDMVKDVMAEVNKHEEKINAELNSMGKQYQDKRMGYQSKQEKGQMSQQEYEAALADIANTEKSIAARKQALDQEYSEMITQKKMTMRKAIQEYVAKYNKTHDYTYILADEPGIFYYKDSVYNITKDVIKGLNDQYKEQKKK